MHCPCTCHLCPCGDINHQLAYLPTYLPSCQPLRPSSAPTLPLMGQVCPCFPLHLLFTPSPVKRCPSPCDTWGRRVLPLSFAPLPYQAATLPCRSWGRCAPAFPCTCCSPPCPPSSAPHLAAHGVAPVLCPLASPSSDPTLPLMGQVYPRFPLHLLFTPPPVKRCPSPCDTWGRCMLPLPLAPAPALQPPDPTQYIFQCNEL